MSRCAPELVATEKMRCKRFLKGLRKEIQTYLTATPPRVVSELTASAKSLEQVQGLTYGSSSGQGGASGGNQSYSSNSQSFSGRNRNRWNQGRGASSQGARSDRRSESAGRRRQCTSSPMMSPESSQRSSGVPTCHHCWRSHRGVCWSTIRACYYYGSSEHLVKDYPKKAREMSDQA